MRRAKEMRIATFVAIPLHRAAILYLSSTIHGADETPELGKLRRLQLVLWLLIHEIFLTVFVKIWLVCASFLVLCMHFSTAGSHPCLYYCACISLCLVTSWLCAFVSRVHSTYYFWFVCTSRASASNHEIPTRGDCIDMTQTIHHVTSFFVIVLWQSSAHLLIYTCARTRLASICRNSRTQYAHKYKKNVMCAIA